MIALLLRIPAHDARLRLHSMTHLKTRFLDLTRKPAGGVAATKKRIETQRMRRQVAPILNEYRGQAKRKTDVNKFHSIVAGMAEQYNNEVTGGVLLLSLIVPTTLKGPRPFKYFT